MEEIIKRTLSQVILLMNTILTLQMMKFFRNSDKKNLKEKPNKKL